MSMWELFVIAAGLSMDAFAVSVCKGLAVDKVRPRHVLITGVYFGGFQALMPFIGYTLGTQFQSLIAGVDHWIAFVLLGFIGVNMIRESRGGCDRLDDSFSFKTMLPLAVATSIDALMVGITLAFLQVHIVPAVCFIGAVTFVFSAVGVSIGRMFGARYKAGAELAGGIALIVIGLKILLEHLGFLG